VAALRRRRDARAIRREFGAEVGRLVDEVTNLAKPESGNRASRLEVLTKGNAALRERAASRA
jgi:(p)ppGpp synthase/HD superfamily hydrolase